MRPVALQDLLVADALDDALPLCAVRGQPLLGFSRLELFAEGMAFRNLKRLALSHQLIFKPLALGVRRRIVLREFHVSGADGGYPIRQVGHKRLKALQRRHDLQNARQFIGPDPKYFKGVRQALFVAVGRLALLQQQAAQFIRRRLPAGNRQPDRFTRERWPQRISGYARLGGQLLPAPAASNPFAVEPVSI
jgi:hypothetical protein